MLPVYNEEDIIEEVVEHLLDQGLELVVLDNGSTDRTYEICKKIENKNLLNISQFKTSTYAYEWDSILRTLYDMALVHSPDWVIRSDSDEFLSSGIDGVNLKDAITQVDEEGQNLIQFNRFDFFMTDDDDLSAKSIKKKLPYYSYHGDFLYRAWKYSPGIKIGYAGGHYPIFPEGLPYLISPRKFVMRHYTFRSKEQALKKMKGRTRGTNYNKTKQGVNAHIKHILEQDFTKAVNYNLLTKNEENGNWNYEMKYCPYIDSVPPKKEEIFTKDGKLKIKHKTQYQLELELHELLDKVPEIWLRRRVVSTKRKIKNFFGMKTRSKDEV